MDEIEFANEIELAHLPNSKYMEKQNDINQKMRAILIDWLVDVHHKFKLLPETLFLTVNLIDRFLSLKDNISRNQFQLIGVTALEISCKYVEIYHPKLSHFNYVAGGACTKEEILQMEQEILTTLQYNFTVPSTLKYLEIYNIFLKIDEISYMFCRYLLELFLIEYEMLKYNPRLLASSAIYITIKIIKKDQFDYGKIFDLTGYNEHIIRDCCKHICFILDYMEYNNLRAVKKKFSLSQFLEVSKLEFNYDLTS